MSKEEMAAKIASLENQLTADARAMDRYKDSVAAAEKATAIEVADLKHEVKKLTLRNDALQYSMVLMQELLRAHETRQRHAQPHLPHEYRFDKASNTWACAKDVVALAE